jgi:Na+/H+ antiporter NhaA
MKATLEWWKSDKILTISGFCNAGITFYNLALSVGTQTLINGTVS